MKYGIRLRRICLSVLLCCFVLQGQEKMQSPLGEAPYPLMSHDGTLNIFYGEPGRGIRLASKKEGESCYGVYDIHADKNISQPVAKRDRTGEIWLAWEKEHSGGSVIQCAKMSGKTIDFRGMITKFTGENHSPDFTFDEQNRMWLTWVSYIRSECRVFVSNSTSGKTWMLNAGRTKSALNPKIVADGQGRIWVFWTGVDTGRDEIFYSLFEGVRWSAPLRIHKKNDVPHLFPDLGLGPDGHPRIVWAAYDGQDYEIFYSRWEGSQWSSEQPLTQNGELDSFPVIGFNSNGFPIVFWVRSGASRTGIFCRIGFGDRWSQEKAVFEIGLSSRSFPRIDVLGDKVGIVWQSKETIKSKILSLIQIESLEDHPESPDKQIVINKDLEENKYIGFGDSITEGWIDYEYVPHLGYVPRLESLLYKTFGPSQVINAGWGGEVTEQGLARMPAVISSHQARYLLLMEGTNDVVFKQISMDSTVFHLEKMIEICHDFGVFVVLSTIIPRKDKRWEKEFFRDRIFDLNDKIRELVSEEKIPLVDMFNIFFAYPESDGGWTSLISDDRVHPSIEGYELMSESWFEEIKKLPFPPVDVKAKRLRGEVANSVQEGNLVRWRHSPKISDMLLHKAYRIYRVDLRAQNREFVLVKTLPLAPSDARIAGSIGFRNFSDYGQAFLDLGFDRDQRYAYTLILVRQDGVEGPCSVVANDGS